ncbi:MAG TPA: cupredoxin domain-containing protein [Candidatus Limnocylindria bacterium]|jgi:plastocyanin|nr:cupredoxin domain-containing protein [Candidatus Limnocylindria bacterium]
MSEQTATFTQTAPRHESGLVFPALLIALGGLFLLSNFGVIAPVSVRSVLSLWPLAPVLIGTQLLLGRDRPSLALGLQLITIVLGLALITLRASLAPLDIPSDASLTQGASAAIAGAPAVVVSATDIHFSLSEIHLPAREVNLTLQNDGVLPHDLTVPALGVHMAAGAGQTVTTGLRDLVPGRYTGYCSVTGHAEAGMRLVVIVE